MSVLAAGRLVHALAHRACAQPLLLAQQHAAFASLHMGLHPTHSSLLAGAPAGAVRQQPQEQQQQLRNVSELGFRCGFNEEYRMGEALGTGSFGQVTTLACKRAARGVPLQKRERSPLCACRCGSPFIGRGKRLWSGVRQAFAIARVKPLCTRCHPPAPTALVRQQSK